jgi:four helix bundle protein
MKNFRELRIWWKGMDLVKQVYLVAEQLPSEERFALRSQVTRAAVSIPSNIAEGSSRQSDLDYKRFLEMSLGSAFELETQLLIVQELVLIPNPESLNPLIAELQDEQRMINGLISTLIKASKAK